LESKCPCNNQSIIRRQDWLKQLRDGPLHWEIALGDFLETLESWLRLNNFDNAKWICRQWVEIIMKKFATKILEARKKGWRGNTQPVMDLGGHTSKKVGCTLPELPNTIFMVVIRCVSNGYNISLSPNQLQAVYNDERHWEEQIDFINKNKHLKEPYILTLRSKCTL
jgi:hypothetical protein